MSISPTVELDAQYRQLREECGLVPRPERALVSVTGAEAAEYLQGQVTNDVEALAPGEGLYAALLDRKGHIETDLRILRTSAEELLLDVAAAALPVALRHLTMYSVGREVVIADQSEERRILSLIGPRSAEVAAAPPLPEDATAEVAMAGIAALAVGTGNGIDLICAAGDEERLAAALRDAGAVDVSPEAAELLRIEAGVPRYGVEMKPGTLPAEAGIVERAVSFEKGCYIGQETVVRLAHRGKPNRHLRGLRLSAAATPGATLRLGEKEVGKLGGAAVSPALGPIGLAIVRREAEPGAELSVGEDGVKAVVVDLPFG